MDSKVATEFNLMLTDAERMALLDILEQELKETEVELHRTKTFGAKDVIAHKEATIRSLLRKTRGG